MIINQCYGDIKIIECKGWERVVSKRIDLQRYLNKDVKEKDDSPGN